MYQLLLWRERERSGLVERERGSVLVERERVRIGIEGDSVFGLVKRVVRKMIREWFEIRGR